MTDIVERLWHCSDNTRDEIERVRLISSKTIADYRAECPEEK